MKKKTYEKPTFTVIKIQQRQILASSGDPIQREVPLWGGEDDVHEYRGNGNDGGSGSAGGTVWDDEW